MNGETIIDATAGDGERRVTLTWRARTPRPAVECVVGRVPRDAWRMFSRYHYLTADLNQNARCFSLWANGRLAAFAGVLYRPHALVSGVYGVSRLVTLPDWQGLGLAFALADRVGAIYRAHGCRLRTYPAHPALMRAFDRSPVWALAKTPQDVQPPSSSKRGESRNGVVANFGGRFNATFEYVGPAMDFDEAARVGGGLRDYRASSKSPT